MMLLFTSVYAQDLTVRGTVSDTNGEPVIGATVKCIGTKNGSLTNVDGAFTIKCSPNANLEISYIGYETQKVAVKGKTTVNVVLQETAASLNEVVVTAMGIRKDAKKLGYAVSSISSEDLNRTGGTNIAAGLYGKASGVPSSQLQVAVRLQCLLRYVDFLLLPATLSLC